MTVYTAICLFRMQLFNPIVPSHKQLTLYARHYRVQPHVYYSIISSTHEVCFPIYTWGMEREGCGL